MAATRVAIDGTAAEELTARYSAAARGVGAVAAPLPALLREAATLLSIATPPTARSLETLATELDLDGRDLDWRRTLVTEHDGSNVLPLVELVADRLERRAQFDDALEMIESGVPPWLAVVAALEARDPAVVALAVANGWDYETARAVKLFGDLEQLSNDYANAHPYVQEQIDARRRALIEELAGTDEPLVISAVLRGLDDGDSAAAAFAGIGRRLEDMAHEFRVRQVMGEHDLPFADAALRLEEMQAAVERLVAAGFDVEDAATVVNASHLQDLDLGEIERLAAAEGLTLIDAATLINVAGVYAMTAEEYQAFVGFREHFSVFDDPRGGRTDDKVTDDDLRYVVENPSQFAADIVATAHALLRLSGLRHRLDTARDNDDVLTADGVFGDDERDDGTYGLDDLVSFEAKQQINFLLGGYMDAIDVAAEGGDVDGFRSRKDYETFLNANRPHLTAEEIWALTTVIEGEWYDKGWWERNKRAIALSAAVVAGAAIVIGTGGIGSGVTGALITTAAAGAAGAGAAGLSTLSINAFSEESPWHDDLVANSLSGFLAGAGSGGAVLGVSSMGSMTLAGRAATVLGVTSDVSGLVGMGALDLGLQYAPLVGGDNLADTHDFADALALITAVPALATAGFAGARMIGNRIAPATVPDFARAIAETEGMLDPIARRQVLNDVLRASDQYADDLVRSGVTDADIALMEAKLKPLGFDSPQQFEQFRGELGEALRAAGLDDAEIGLKGTATTFYSENPGKPLGHHWDADPANLGDYDLNITSATMVDGLDSAGVAPNPKYNVFSTRHLEGAFPELRDFARRWREVLGRDVNFVGYPEPTARDTTEYIVTGGLAQ